MDVTEKLLKKCKSLGIAATATTAAKAIVLIFINSILAIAMRFDYDNLALQRLKFVLTEVNIIATMAAFLLSALWAISAAEYFQQRYCRRELTQAEMWEHLCAAKKRSTICWSLFIIFLLTYLTIRILFIMNIIRSVNTLTFLFTTAGFLYSLLPLVGIMAALFGIKKFLLQNRFATVSAEPRPLNKLFSRTLLAASAAAIIAQTIRICIHSKYSSLIHSGRKYEEIKATAQSLMETALIFNLIATTAFFIVLFFGFLLLSRVFTEPRDLTIQQATKRCFIARCTAWSIWAAYLIIEVVNAFLSLQITISYINRRGFAGVLKPLATLFSNITMYAWILLPLVFLWWVCTEIWKKTAQNEQENKL